VILCLVDITEIVDHHSLKLSFENDTVDTIGFILFSKGKLDTKTVIKVNSEFTVYLMLEPGLKLCTESNWK